MKPTRVLFICHGNICRSAMAEVMFLYEIERRGIASRFIVDSAATSREEIGNPMYPPAVRELAGHGMKPIGHRARQITKADYDNFDYLIGMDSENLRNMKRWWPDDDAGKISLLLDFTNWPRSVADPWYTGDFEATYRDIEQGIDGFLRYLSEKK